MRRTSLNKEQAIQLANILRARRAEMRLTVRDVAAESGLQLATISGLETGTNLTPQPDTVNAIAKALELSVSDLYAAVGWLPAGELPNFRPYMRAKYRDLPDEAVSEVEAFIQQLAKRHDLQGPHDHEDESE